jgi:hypothetical protein
MRKIAVTGRQMLLGTFKMLSRTGHEAGFRGYKMEVRVLVDAVFEEALRAVKGLFEAKKML